MGRLGSLLNSVGFASFPGTDDAFVAPRASLLRLRYPPELTKPFVTSEVVRDWSLHAGEWSFAPYDPLSFEALPADAGWIPSLWPCRTSILGTVSFGGKTRRDLGDDWWTWYRWVPEKYRTQRSITFAFVATHHHFVLDRGGKVFKQSAPVIKLPADADERKHLELLGVLNSATACFWMKQVFHNKGAGGGKRVEAGFAARGSEEWENHFEHDGTKLQAFPLPRELDRPRGVRPMASSVVRRAES